MAKAIASVAVVLAVSLDAVVAAADTPIPEPIGRVPSK